MNKVKWSGLYKYTKQTVTARVPAEAGIYLVYVELKEGGWEPIYAGKADNLKKRLREHFYDKEENECLKYYIQENYSLACVYAAVTRHERRKAFEKYLIVYLEPECNTKINDVIRINIP